MTTEQKLTPAQKQYMDLRNQYKDCILFFRMGDFYETFYEDAKTCAKLLDLTITTRDRTSKTPIPWQASHTMPQINISQNLSDLD